MIRYYDKVLEGKAIWYTLILNVLLWYELKLEKDLGLTFDKWNYGSGAVMGIFFILTMCFSSVLYVSPVLWYGTVLLVVTTAVAFNLYNTYVVYILKGKYEKSKTQIYRRGYVVVGMGYGLTYASVVCLEPLSVGLMVGAALALVMIVGVYVWLALCYTKRLEDGYYVFRK